MSERWREDAPWEGVGERAACATCDSFVVSPLLLLLSVRKGMTMTKVVVIVAEPILNERNGAEYENACSLLSMIIWQSFSNPCIKCAFDKREFI